MLGVCYYPEHWPETRWAQDARQMRECGLELVRIGEFAWSKIEPRENEYDWDWLDRAIETLAAEGLRIILGTPTATPPAWLTSHYPDVLRVGNDGRRWSHGGRRQTCPTSATNGTYQTHSTRIVAEMSRRYGSHPAVVAWQIDNELGNHSTGRCYCEQCRVAFQQWCKARYATLDQINTAWGAVFWSQSFSDWEQIPQPSDPVGGGHNPSLQLAYRRFSSDTHVEIVRQQVAILRDNSPGRTITTNIAPLDDELDWHAIAAEVDVMSWDNYPHGFEHPADVAFFHDLVRGLKRKPFWVTEQQAGRINWMPYNPPVPPGQVKLWTQQAIAHGAENVMYFRWRACRYGQEQYHSGLLNHDTSFAQGYIEARELAAQLKKDPPIRRAKAEVALLISYPDFWTIQTEPHHADFDYWRLARAVYRDFWQHGINVDVIARGQDVSQYRHVLPIAPVLIDPDEANRWRAFVVNGGHLTLTIRSFVKDQDSVWTDQPMPAGLTELIGGQVVQWYSLPPTMSGSFERHSGATVQVHTWIDELRAVDETSVLRYVPGSIPGIAALNASCSRAYGTNGGQVDYIGVYPPVAQAALFSRVGAHESTEQAMGGSVEVERITLDDGTLTINHATIEHQRGQGEQQPLPPLGIIREHTLHK